LSVTVWRIAADAPTYTADDLTGEGARITGGRWNRQGIALIYASSSIALSCLETVVNLRAGGLPLNRYLVQIDIPDAIWQRAERLQSGRHVGWDAIPPGKVSLDIGDTWCASLSSALLLIPSVIIPEESNILINPRHPDIASISATKLRRWNYDMRLRSTI
jgi:RES domain-containing protein